YEKHQPTIRAGCSTLPNCPEASPRWAHGYWRSRKLRGLKKMPGTFYFLPPILNTCEWPRRKEIRRRGGAFFETGICKRDFRRSRVSCNRWKKRVRVYALKIGGKLNFSSVAYYREFMPTNSIRRMLGRKATPSCSRSLRNSRI